MTVADAVAARSEVPRRLIILDRNYRIISQQSGGDEALLGFTAYAFHLPPALEEAVRAATGTPAYADRGDARVFLDEALCMRVFPLVGTRVQNIGVLFERYRCRAGDV